MPCKIRHYFHLPLFSLLTARKQAFSSLPRDDDSDYRIKEEGLFRVYDSRKDL